MQSRERQHAAPLKSAATSQSEDGFAHGALPPTSAFRNCHLAITSETSLI